MTSEVIYVKIFWILFLWAWWATISEYSDSDSLCNYGSSSSSSSSGSSDIIGELLKGLWPLLFGVGPPKACLSSVLNSLA